MANKMLIDAAHPEETRVVVLRGNRVEEFDFEAANRKQLRGNIYLAKVTRVEPSLQAAFVDYGGNRHGFLAFSEIHPDYYQIPVADRQALLEEERLRHSPDDDFEPADDEAGLQEIDETFSDDDDDDDQDEAVAAAEDEPDGDTGDADLSADDSASADDADDNGDADAEPETAADETEEALSEDDPDADGDTTKPDRFLSATKDEDAKISGEPPFDTPEGETPDAQSELATAEPAEAVADADATEAKSADESADVAESETDPSDVSDQDAPSAVTASAEDTADSAADAPVETEPSDDQAEQAEAEVAAEEQEGTADETVSEPEAKTSGREGGRSRGRGSKRKSANGSSSDGDSAPARPRRRYKIQEVIKRRQIILVQVVKEERGTKGAALTTYLSLAGRYSVLMPNSARGGGISRKITNPGDRKRLKQIAGELPVPEGMGVILRTAGASRTKTEIKRDFEYLMRLWENVRDLTLNSSAPTLVYEEGNLVKRSIRDLYNKDIGEVLVAGDTGYREAKDFMRMLMPSHAKNVQPYKDRVPIFAKHRVEQQLDAMFLPQVTLPSGGYVVINQTEALVAVDVNSGKATREHNIEDTALRTNVEAAEEIARQLRLRDLAGLIVIDFIDMEEKRNNRTVERKLKDCLKTDRARIQVGRISHFGLLEMSRQRLRTGVLESSTEICPHCHGTGVIRSTESVALHVLRTIEDQLLRNASHNLNVRIRTEVALYIINQKRHYLTDIEERYGISMNLLADETIEDAYCIIDRAGSAESRRPRSKSGSDFIQPDTIDPDEFEENDEVEAEAENDEEGGRKKRRRKRRRRGRDSDQADRAASDRNDDDRAEEPSAEAQSAEADAEAGDGGDEASGKKRRRGRRGGRRNKRSAESNVEAEAASTEADAGQADEPASDDDTTTMNGAEAPENIQAADTEIETAADDTANGQAEGIAEAKDDAVTEAAEEAGDTSDAEPSDSLPEENVEAAEEDDDTIEQNAVSPPPAEQPEGNRPKKSGWWQRRGFF
ncbi:MAG: Rne/Rng family ribonuclease [Pseudomonadota bacterium]